MYDVSQSELVEKVAEELKKIPEIKPPAWAGFVKTGPSKERPPTNPDWWFVRVASILRNVRKFGPIGVSKLRTKYGGRKNLGAEPEHFYKGSGSIIRKIFQQLEKAQLLKQEEKKGHKGRVITPKGISLLDKAASQLYKLKPKEEKEVIEKEKPLEKKEEPKKEPIEKKSVEKEIKKEPVKEKATEQKPKEQPKKEEKKEQPIKKPTVQKKTNN